MYLRLIPLEEQRSWVYLHSTSPWLRAARGGHEIPSTYSLPLAQSEKALQQRVTEAGSWKVDH